MGNEVAAGGRVVNTIILVPSTGALDRCPWLPPPTWNSISAPSLRPIQLRCISLMESAQSKSSRSSSSLGEVRGGGRV